MESVQQPYEYEKCIFKSSSFPIEQIHLPILKPPQDDDESHKGSHHQRDFSRKWHAKQNAWFNVYNWYIFNFMCCFVMISPPPCCLWCLSQRSSVSVDYAALSTAAQWMPTLTTDIYCCFVSALTTYKIFNAINAFFEHVNPPHILNAIICLTFSCLPKGIGGARQLFSLLLLQIDIFCLCSLLY